MLKNRMMAACTTWLSIFSYGTQTMPMAKIAVGMPMEIRYGRYLPFLLRTLSMM